MKSDIASILKQFEPIERLFADISSGRNGYPPDKVSAFYTLCFACIERIVGTENAYYRRAMEEMNANYLGILDEVPRLPPHVTPLYGVIYALKEDVATGHLSALRELIHADMFSDFLETAEYFLEEGYKDPAAVMIGGVLEEHLRHLCIKNGIAIEFLNPSGVMKPKMGDALNNDLHRANIYGKLEQKQITAWLDLRNKAAHTKYGEYDQQQVALFLQGLRDFVAKFPA